MNLIDNITTRLGDDLKQEIKRGSRMAIAASSFSIYAFEALKKELRGIEQLRFIFSSPTLYIHFKTIMSFRNTNLYIFGVANVS